MASIPFLSGASPAKRRRQPMTGPKLIIVSVSVGFALFILWAMLAQVDEVTAGQGRVIPTSKVQLIQATEPATVSELLVRSGQRVRRGQLLARLDDTQSTSALGQIEAETRSLTERAARLQGEGMNTGATVGSDEAALRGTSLRLLPRGRWHRGSAKRMIFKARLTSFPSTRKPPSTTARPSQPGPSRSYRNASTAEN